jgi:outer membrane protein assembly factor BamB
MRLVQRVLLPLALGCGLAACGTNGNSAGDDAAAGLGGAVGTAGTGGGVPGTGGTTGGGTAGAGGGTAGLGGSAGTTGGGTGGRGGVTGSLGGTTGSSGGTTGGGSGGATGSVGGATGSVGGATGGTPSVSVLQHHADLARDGVYTDTRLTRAATGTMHLDPTFGNAALMGPVFAQPLYLAGANGGPDLVIAATERNHVYALNAATGAQVWDHAVGTPVSAGLPCGNIAGNGNTLGITGTPVIDGATRRIYLDAMTADTTVTAKHFIHALNIDSLGAEVAGWPIDVNAAAVSGGTMFSSIVQNQRAALTLLGGKVFVAYGGHVGDCAGYHGWLVGVSTTTPTQVNAWATTAIAGGIWGTSGIASDGTSLFVATGNTKAAATSGAGGTSPPTWGGGEAVIKFPTTVVQPPLTQVSDYFFPSGWAALDMADADLGGTGPILVTVPGATPANLVVALGKDRNAYLLDRAMLGGMDAQPLARLTVAGGAIINAAAAYRTPTATYVVLRNSGPVGCPTGQTGGLTAFRISATSPPALSIAWCGGPATVGSPAVSVTDATGANATVWVVASDNRLHGLNGDTGASVFAGGAATDAVAGVRQLQTPIIANGRIFVASDTRIFAFTP